MTESDPSNDRSISFVRRPIPLPGDLRISWRIYFLVQILGRSRAKKSSLARINILHDASKANSHVEKLRAIIYKNAKPSSWRIRIDPSSGRAVDFLVGFGLADWVMVAGRVGVHLTAKGIEIFEGEEVRGADILGEYQDVFDVSKGLTESLVSKILSSRGF